MNPHLENALQNFRINLVRYSKTERYYRGDHDLAFATEKFQSAFGSLFRQFALNLCPAICDAVRDKLKITGFSIADHGRTAGVPPARTGAPTKVETDPALIQSDIDHIWRRGRMAVRAGEIHKEALKNGDAYAIVWYDPEGGISIYPQRAANCTVAYDDENPGRILRAAKHWREPNGRTRLNIFYPDRIERYITRKPAEDVIPSAKEFIQFGMRNAERGIETEKAETDEFGNPNFEIPNPFGVVPVFHFANNADLGLPGQSELKDAIPIQDGLNKSVLDMLVAMEYSAYRQRWVTGLEVETDAETGRSKEPFKAGTNRVWIASGAEAKFGDFAATDLEQFLKVKVSFRVDVASVTGTPLHYFLQNTRGFASGEALRKVETRFLAKVRDRQAAFGDVWAQAMSFALRLAGHGSIDLITQWEDPAPIAEADLLQNLLLKKQLGLSTVQALREAGYGDIDIDEMIRVETPTRAETQE